MKKITRNNIKNLPYSLHDAVVNSIEFKENGILMHFQDGFYGITKTVTQVNEKIEIENIDWDFSYVYLLEYKDVLCGNVGELRGIKMELRTFVDNYKNYRFEIIDETYGYNTSKFDGYFSDGESEKECRIEIYHLGDMSYIVDET